MKNEDKKMEGKNVKCLDDFKQLAIGIPDKVNDIEVTVLVQGVNGCDNGDIQGKEEEEEEEESVFLPVISN